MEDEIFELRMLINDIIDTQQVDNYSLVEWIRERLSEIPNTTLD